MTPEGAALVNALYEAAPDASAVAELARSGSAALRNRDPAAWQKWGEDVANSDCRDLARFLAGLTSDQAALANALTLPYSNGPTEGHVNRVKLTKRSMYGRASFELLRNKILYQAA